MLSLALATVARLRVVDRLLELDRATAVSVREDVEVTVTTGTIKKVVSDRGFGFIAAEDGKEYFFHRDGLTASLDFDRLAGGEKVQFDVEQSPKGARAKNVQSA
jgi:CspA family cold shock protein